MMMKEFAERTGFYPSPEMYTVIEEFYMKFGGDKDAFCKAYSENKNGLAERIQQVAGFVSSKAEKDADDQIEALETRIAHLEDELEREQEWHPYDDEHNVPQTDYERLKLAGGTRELTDIEAKELLYDWYGFAMDKITIHRAMPKYEVNRHRSLRKVGEIDRAPLYNATDWNYIRFDCGCMSYELYNDTLRFFLH